VIPSNWSCHGRPGSCWSRFGGAAWTGLVATALGAVGLWIAMGVLAIAAVHASIATAGTVGSWLATASGFALRLLVGALPRLGAAHRLPAALVVACARCDRLADAGGPAGLFTAWMRFDDQKLGQLPSRCFC